MAQQRGYNYQPGNRGQHSVNRRTAPRQTVTTYQRNSRSRSIYQPPHRRGPNWLLIIAIVIALAVVVGVVLHFTACSKPAEEPAAQQQEQQAETTPAAETEAEPEPEAETKSTTDENGAVTTVIDESTGAAAVVRTADQRKEASTSKNSKKPTVHVCYLTFDDGPSENTPKILEILDKYGIKATWFVIGRCTKPEYIETLWENDHQIALHSYTHEYDQVYASSSAFFNEMDQIGSMVKEHIGFKPSIIRFPGGSVNDYNRGCRSDIFDEIAGEGYHFFDWNVSSTDASGNNVPAEKIIKSIKKESKGNNSCCVLMHDTEAKSTTVEALPDIIEYYISEGYTFDVLLSDSFGYQF